MSEVPVPLSDDEVTAWLTEADFSLATAIDSIAARRGVKPA
jgi:hypothetical protein